MNEVVVDTNVAKTANGEADHVGPDCVAASMEALRGVKSERILLLDDQGLIVREYVGSGLSYAGGPGFGSAFFKWVFDNQANTTHCRKVSITPTPDNGDNFAEFPSDPELAGFDRDDRKFVAVALASGENPPILNATDTDWWDFREALQRNGVTVTFLCPEAMQRGV